MENKWICYIIFINRIIDYDWKIDMYEMLCNKVMGFLKRNIELTDQKAEQIEYGIYVILLNAGKFIILLTVACMLGIVKYVCISVASFGLERTFVNGVHAKKPFSCLVTTNIIFIAIVYLSIFLSSYSMVTGIASLMMGMAIIGLYAPGDTEKRPLRSRKLKKRLKILSCFAIIVLYCFSLFTQPIISNIIMLSALMGCLLTTPIAYKIANEKGGTLR